MQRFVLILIAFSLALVLVSAIDIEISNGGTPTPRIFNLEPLVLIINTFLDLFDTPDSYAGSNSFCVTVNSGGTGLEFINCTVAGGDGNTQKGTDGFFLFNDTETIFFNGTQLNSTIAQHGLALGFNSTFNATYAEFSYNFSQVAESVFWYNQTIGAIDFVNSQNFMQNLTEGWIVNFTTLFSNDWSNVTITESQISDLTHTPLTNVAWVNNSNIFIEQNDFTALINITASVVFDKATLNITNNQTCIIINGLTSRIEVC